MTMITPSYLGETIEYSSLHACRSTLEDPTIALKGDARATVLLWRARKVRKYIQSSKKVSDQYIWGIMQHDLPPNAKALRSLRAKWWALTGKRA